jgi:integrase/recombinase XerD
MMQGKQAKIVSPTQERAILGYLATTRYPARDRVMFLLSMKAGLRAKEMVSLTWAMGDRCDRAGGRGAPRPESR